MSPTRELYFNIEGAAWVYALLGVALVIFGWGVLRRLRGWLRGQPVNRSDSPRQRLEALLRGAALHECCSSARQSASCTSWACR